MTWEGAASIILGIWTGIGLLWWLLSGSLVFRAARRSEHAMDTTADSDGLSLLPPVSVFKSLPALQGNIPEAWTRTALCDLAAMLDHKDQLILGYRPEDKAIWKEQLFSSLKTTARVELVALELGTDLSHNRKIVALSQLAPYARHPLWFWSDADIRLPENGWYRIKSEWTSCTANGLTFPYRLVHRRSVWGELEALYVNAEFLPGVQTARMLATESTVSFSLGAGILFRGGEFMTAEKWDDLSRDLADDFRLGQQLEHVQLSSQILLETEAGEDTLLGALNHYLRWHKTVRWSQPLGYFGQIALLPLLGWIIAGLLYPTAWTLSGLALTWGADLIAGILLMQLNHSTGPGPRWWLPLWPLLRPLAWIAVWIPWPVAWRENLWWQRRRNTATYHIMSEATPHPALKPHYESLDEKQAFLRKVFDSAAPFYEGIASWGFFGSGDWYRKQALTRCGLKLGMKAVDVAAGTGPTARAVAHVVGSPDLVTAVEPSEGMMKESMKLLDCTHHQAPAEKLPLGDAEFDYLTMGFALRHVNDLEAAFKEYFRVLKPGSTCCVLDLTMPKNPIGRFFVKLYFKHILPFLTRVITGNKDAEYLMAYYWDTLDQMVPRETVVQYFESAGFTDVKHHVVIGMFSEYTAQKP